MPVGWATDEHYHPIAEELYFITSGQPGTCASATSAST